MSICLSVIKNVWCDQSSSIFIHFLLFLLLPEVSRLSPTNLCLSTILTWNYAPFLLIRFSCMYKYGGAYNWIKVIILVYTPPFLVKEHAKGNSNGRIVRHPLMRLAMKLVVAQFCMAKIMNEWRCRVCAVRKRDVVITQPPASYEPAQAPCSQLLCQCIAGQ